MCSYSATTYMERNHEVTTRCTFTTIDSQLSLGFARLKNEDLINLLFISLVSLQQLRLEDLPPRACIKGHCSLFLKLCA